MRKHCPGCATVTQTIKPFYYNVSKIISLIANRDYHSPGFYKNWSRQEKVPGCQNASSYNAGCLALLSIMDSVTNSVSQRLVYLPTPHYYVQIHTFIQDNKHDFIFEVCLLGYS